MAFIGSFDTALNVDTSDLQEAQQRVRAFSQAMTRDFGRLGQTTSGLVTPLESIPDGLRRMDTGLRRVRGGSGAAQSALVALGGGIEDAAFNIRFAANNLTFFIQQLGFAATEARAMGISTSRHLLRNLIGSGGLVIAISTLVALGPKLVDFFRKGEEGARKMGEALKTAREGIFGQLTLAQIGTVLADVQARRGREALLSQAAAASGDPNVRFVPNKVLEEEEKILLDLQRKRTAEQNIHNRLRTLGIDLSRKEASAVRAVVEQEERATRERLARLSALGLRQPGARRIEGIFGTIEPVTAADVRGELRGIPGAVDEAVSSLTDLQIVSLAWTDSFSAGLADVLMGLRDVDEVARGLGRQLLKASIAGGLTALIPGAGGFAAGFLGNLGFGAFQGRITTTLTPQDIQLTLDTNTATSRM